MSKQSTSSTKMSKRLTQVTIYTLLIIVLSTIPSYSNAFSEVKVEIESSSRVLLDSQIEIDITFNSIRPDISFDSFDLLIKIDTAIFTLVDIQLGQLLVDCGWQNFNYSVTQDQYIHISSSVGNNPSCYLQANEGILATMIIYVERDFLYECVDVPVDFYWESCDNNLFMNTSESKIYLSQDVYDYEGNVLGESTELPTLNGAPDFCISEFDSSFNVFKLQDFQNGIVDIMCSDFIDETGDINLNDIDYEIADYVLFANYIMYGDSVFSINLVQQIASTDVNKDGIFLTLNDLTYIYQVITGNALPLPDNNGTAEYPTGLTAFFIQDTLAQTVSVITSETLSAVYMEFDGEIIPELTNGNVGFYIHLNNKTKLLIDPLSFLQQNMPEINSGLLINYTGSADLDSVMVGSYDNMNIPTMFLQNPNTTICGDVDGSSVFDLSDVIYIISFVFGGFPVPIGGDGDVDCNGFIDVSDAVYLISYMFNNGPAPCSGCP